MRYWAIGIFCATLAVSHTSFARAVYLNGVDISTVRNQTFKKVTVTIDPNGDIRIDAPNYQVEVLEPPKKEAVASQGGPNVLLKNKYFLVTQPSLDGKAQYDFVISVNGVEYRTIKAGSSQLIIEISSWLHRGDNEIVVFAKKNLTGGRQSTSSAHEARLLIGVGHEDGKTVKIDKVKAKLSVNASELTDKKKHFVLTAE